MSRPKSLKPERFISIAQIGELRQVDNGKRRGVFDPIAFAVFHVGIADDLTEFCAAHSGIFGESPDPTRIVPADRGFSLFGGSDIARQAV